MYLRCLFISIAVAQPRRGGPGPAAAGCWLLAAGCRLPARLACRGARPCAAERVPRVHRLAKILTSGIVRRVACARAYSSNGTCERGGPVIMGARARRRYRCVAARLDGPDVLRESNRSQPPIVLIILCPECIGSLTLSKI